MEIISTIKSAMKRLSRGKVVISLGDLSAILALHWPSKVSSDM